MTLYVGYGVFGVVAGMAVLQVMFAVAYVRQLLGARKATRLTRFPKAAVVLSVRGPDPFFEANIKALLDQDYPDFRLFIVVDNEHDSAWPQVHRVRSMAPDRVETLVLRNPLSTCSLKCSSLAEAVEQLDDSYEVVAFLDGDAPPYRRWLRDLVEPLAEPSVGVTTGNRWYTPKRIGWGTLVRHFWNAGAVVQVWLNGITWAGSMAMRHDVIREIGLVAAWRRAFADDAAVVRKMRAHGYKTRFVPSVIMANPEEISLASFRRWAERQMIAAKTADSGWSIILLHAGSIAACMLAPWALLVAAIVAWDAQAASLALSAMAIYWGGAGLSALAIEGAMQRVFRRNQVESPWMTWRVAVWFAPALLLTHLVYLWVLCGACARNRVSWRGVEYEIRGINDIRLLAYRPFESNTDQNVLESVI